MEKECNLTVSRGLLSPNFKIKTISWFFGLLTWERILSLLLKLNDEANPDGHCFCFLKVFEVFTYLKMPGEGQWSVVSSIAVLKLATILPVNFTNNLS